MSPRSLWFRWPALALAIVAVGFGISMMVSAHLGAAPADVLATGGSHRFGIGVGTMGWVVAGVMSVVAVALRRPPQIGSLIGAVGVGQSVNWFLLVLPEPRPIIVRIAMLVIALVVLYIAIAVGVSTNLGTGPIELVMLGLHDRGIAMHVARWGLEGVLLAVGIALGGQFGVATIVFVFATGPVLARILPPVMRFMGTARTD